MSDLREAPHVLVVPYADGEWWQLAQERDLETATIVTYRRANLYVRVRETVGPFAAGRLTYSASFETRLINELPVDDLAAELGRQIALAMHAHLRGEELDL